MVSTPSSGIPASSHRPEVPAPVPISATWRACTAAAMKREGGTGSRARGVGVAELNPAPARGLDDLRLGHELLGIGPAGRLELAHGATLRPEALGFARTRAPSVGSGNPGTNAQDQTRIDG